MNTEIAACMANEPQFHYQQKLNTTVTKTQVKVKRSAYVNTATHLPLSNKSKMIVLTGCFAAHLYDTLALACNLAVVERANPHRDLY